MCVTSPPLKSIGSGFLDDYFQTSVTDSAHLASVRAGAHTRVSIVGIHTVVIFSRKHERAAVPSTLAACCSRGTQPRYAVVRFARAVHPHPASILSVTLYMPEQRTKGWQTTLQVEFISAILMQLANNDGMKPVCLPPCAHTRPRPTASIGFSRCSSISRVTGGGRDRPTSLPLPARCLCASGCLFCRSREKMSHIT